MSYTIIEKSKTDIDIRDIDIDSDPFTREDVDGPLLELSPIAMLYPGMKYKYKDWTDMFPDKVDLIKLSTNSWRKFLFSLKNKKYYQDLEIMLQNEMLESIIYPKPELLFNIFNLLEPSDIKVVIIGQDPYISSYGGVPQATGSSFSLPVGYPKIPPSLQNIFKNLVKYDHIKTHNTGCLSSWISQGVFLLNASLTVRSGSSNSHQKSWEEFYKAVIRYLNVYTKNIVFVMWGKDATKMINSIDSVKHQCIVSSHPSGFSANHELSYTNKKGEKVYAPSFMNNDHFGQINKFLKEKKIKTIDWNVD